MFLISTPHVTTTFTVRLAVTTKYQGNGFAAEVLFGRDHPIKSRPNECHRKRSYVNMMACDHLSCVPVGPYAGELWYFEYFPTTTIRHFDF